MFLNLITLQNNPNIYISHFLEFKMVNKRVDTNINKNMNTNTNKKTNKNINKKVNKKEIIENSQRSIFSTIFSILILLTLISLLSIVIYLLYQNLPGEPELGKVFVQELIDNNDSKILSDVKQFYPNTKFNHNPISYKFDGDCDSEERKNMLDAFNIVSEMINQMTFSEVFSSPDIEISCSINEPPEIEGHYFVAGEGGAKEIIQTGRYNIITTGIILLYNNDNSKTSNCNYPGVELHELMHVFGFDHSNNENSLMYPYLNSCEQVLDQSIIAELRRIYSDENLPDLYFESVTAIREGKYLDFNLTIKNSGSVDAKNIYFGIVDEGKLVQDREIGDLKFGGGISIEIGSLKIFNRDSNEVQFIIDRENLIKELDENNNIAKVKFK